MRSSARRRGGCCPVGSSSTRRNSGGRWIGTGCTATWIVRVLQNRKTSLSICTRHLSPPRCCYTGAAVSGELPGDAVTRVSATERGLRLYEQPAPSVHSLLRASRRHRTSYRDAFGV